jgi:hypothetical protein
MKDQVLTADKEVLFGLSRQYLHGCSIMELRNFVGHAEELLPAALQRREDLPSGQHTIKSRKRGNTRHCIRQCLQCFHPFLVVFIFIGGGQRYRNLPPWGAVLGRLE